ncbi:hypothetical protein HGRIS_005482 [Hohenbuehelia grisea]|uniref:Integrase core domain-containing protein n=1 Tax=Hohenbuehelia grisea TaxID=104357 RepID=A0ABR3JWZ9_9AGAR
MPADRVPRLASVPRKQKNQHKPVPPEEDLKPVIEYYWHLGLNDKKVAEHALDHFDCTKFGLSNTTMKRLRRKWGFASTRQQRNTFETIAPFVQEIRSRFPTMGARSMVSALRQDYGLRVPERLLQDFLKLSEPEAVEARKRYKFIRRTYYTAGVNDVLVFDQHDKWKKYGLFLHAGLDPFPGRGWWLKIWWTNRNPKLIVSYYLEAARRIGGITLTTQSDRGKENNGIANCHTCIRHELDPSLAGTLQHKWKYNTHNIKSEAFWSQLRRQWVPGFEEILDHGVNEGFYDINEPVERLLFRWLAIPWLQAELDSFLARYNSTPRRADRRKILPSAIPDLVCAKPHLYGTRDFKVIVPSEVFDRAEERWAPPDDPVFHLVPPSFQSRVQDVYSSLGNPRVSSVTFWTIYNEVLHMLRQLPEDPALAPDLTVEASAFEVEVPILPGLQNLRNGDAVVGDGAQSDVTDDEAEVEDSLVLDADVLGVDLRLYADFSD